MSTRATAPPASSPATRTSSPSASTAATDDEYLEALDAVLPKAFAFEPQFGFYQSGVDPLKEDTLGKLDLTLEGLAARDRRVFTSAREHGAPLVITIGGGYANPIELTAAAHAQTYRLAAELSP